MNLRYANLLEALVFIHACYPSDMFSKSTEYISVYTRM